MTILKANGFIYDFFRVSSSGILPTKEPGIPMPIKKAIPSAKCSHWCLFDPEKAAILIPSQTVCEPGGGGRTSARARHDNDRLVASPLSLSLSVKDEMKGKREKESWTAVEASRRDAEP